MSCFDEKSVHERLEYQEQTVRVNVLGRLFQFEKDLYLHVIAHIELYLGNAHVMIMYILRYQIYTNIIE